MESAAKVAYRPVQGTAARQSQASYWVAAAIIFTLSSGAAMLQRGDPGRAMHAQTFSRDWWLRPIVEDADAFLPRLEGTVNDVRSLDGRTVVAAGNAGLLAISNDGGAAWTLRPVEVVPANAGTQNPPANNPAASGTRAALIDSWLNPLSVYASDPPPKNQKKDPKLEYPQQQTKQENVKQEDLKNRPPRRPPQNSAPSPITPTIPQSPPEQPHVSYEDFAAVVLAPGEWMLRTKSSAQYRSTDSGVTWVRMAGYPFPNWPAPEPDAQFVTGAHILAAWKGADASYGFAAGTDGVILGWDGARWVHLTRDPMYGSDQRPRVWPAPWYFISLGLCALLVWRGQSPGAAVAEPEGPSIADELTSDRPLRKGDPDALGLARISRGLSRFLRNEHTEPPLTIAISGPWGSGKSSLMNLLKCDLEEFGFRPVWFNAWHHQNEESLLAALMQNIRLQSVPKPWTMEGIIFRARLLWVRSRRNLFPAAVLLALCAWTAGYLIRLGPSAGHIGITFIRDVRLFVDLWTGKSESFDFATNSSLLSFAISFVVVIVGLRRALTAFGVEPAKLMSSMTGGASVRDLEAQTSMRYRFAREFDEVATALGQRNLVVFIDDLDRCQPKQAVDILEAVNFLASSGPCVIVMGMARDLVQRSIGTVFKEASGTDLNLYAGNYLDKLINIEVPVPTAGSQEKIDLLTMRGPAAPAQSQWAFLGEIARKAAPAVVGLALAVGLFQYGSWLAGHPTPAPAATAVASATKPAPGAITGLTPSAPNEVRQSAAPSSPAPRLTRPARAEAAPLYWTVVLIGALLIASLLWLLKQPVDDYAKDSPAFETALRIWEPVIASHNATPRGLKRFKNRVRYYAMMQKPDVPPIPLLDRILGRPAPAPVARVKDYIPEPHLVAMAAICEEDPSCLSTLGAKASKCPEVSEASASHFSQFADFPWDEKFAAAFSKIVGIVTVR